MENRDIYEEKLNRLQLLIYLIPVVGSLAAFWTLFHRDTSTKQQQSVSRLSLNLTFAWLLAYMLLWAGALQNSDILTIRLLYLNGLLTSGYFLVCFGLMVRLVVQGKFPRLPGFSQISNSRRKK